MEIGAADYLVYVCQKHPELSGCRYDINYGTRFYDKEIAEQQINFAKSNNMFVQWSDNAWVYTWCYTCIDVNYWKIEEIKQDIENLNLKYPNTIIPTFDNNLGRHKHAIDSDIIDSWQNSVSFLPSMKFGLSNQSWMCDDAPITNQYTDVNCPAIYLSKWFVDAKNKKAQLIQLEPFWWLFNWPRGNINTYAENISNWNNMGKPTINLVELAKTLGIELLETGIPNSDIDLNNTLDIFDYNILVSKFGNPYTIFDYNTLVANFGKNL